MPRTCTNSGHAVTARDSVIVDATVLSRFGEALAEPSVYGGSETVRLGSCAQSRSTAVTAGAITRFLAHRLFGSVSPVSAPINNTACSNKHRGQRPRAQEWRVDRGSWPRLVGCLRIQLLQDRPERIEPGRERITVGIESFL